MDKPFKSCSMCSHERYFNPKTACVWCQKRFYKEKYEQAVELIGKLIKDPVTAQVLLECHDFVSYYHGIPTDRGRNSEAE